MTLRSDQEILKEKFDELKETDPMIKQTISDLTNLFTIRLALENVSDSPYFAKIREANEVAIMATEAKYQLYITSLLA